jgi:hypothetical protein
LFKRMNEPVGRTVHARDTLTAACSDSEDGVDLEMRGVGMLRAAGVHPHAAHASHKHGQQQAGSMHQPKQVSDCGGKPTALQAERSPLPHKMLRDPCDLHAADEQRMRAAAWRRITDSNVTMEFEPNSANPFSESSGRGCFPEVHAIEPDLTVERRRLRASSPGLPGTLPPAVCTVPKRHSEPGAPQRNSALCASVSPPPACSPAWTTFTQSSPKKISRRRVSSSHHLPPTHNNSPQSPTVPLRTVAKAPVLAPARNLSPDPSYVTFPFNGFAESPVAPVTHMQLQHSPDDCASPEAAMLRACPASPVDSARCLCAAPVARLFTRHSDTAWWGSDTDEDVAFHACGSLEYSVASGPLGALPANAALRPHARLRASSINVPTHDIHELNSAHHQELKHAKDGSAKTAAKDRSHCQQACAPTGAHICLPHTARGLSPCDNTLNILEGSSSMVTPRHSTPITTMLGGNSQDANQLCMSMSGMHVSAPKEPLCAASLVTSTSDDSKLSETADISSSTDNTCMNFMRAAEKYATSNLPLDETAVGHVPTMLFKKRPEVKGGCESACDDVARCGELTRRPSEPTFVHATHTSHSHVPNPVRDVQRPKSRPDMRDSQGAGEAWGMPSCAVGTVHRGNLSKEEQVTHMHKQDFQKQPKHRIDVVKRIFRQLLFLLEVSHAQDLFLGALHPDSLMISWEQKGQGENFPRLHVVRPGYLRELAELEVRHTPQLHL